MDHGVDGDRRYPSPRRLRRVTASIVDFALHGTVAIAAGLWTEQVRSLADLPGVWTLIVWILASFVHRTVIQWTLGTTLGKAVCGLCLIRKEDGRRPRFDQLVKAWLASAWAGVSMVSRIAGGGDDRSRLDDFSLPVVRRCDVHALGR